MRSLALTKCFGLKMIGLRCSLPLSHSQEQAASLGHLSGISSTACDLLLAKVSWHSAANACSDIREVENRSECDRVCVP